MRRKIITLFVSAGLLLGGVAGLVQPSSAAPAPVKGAFVQGTLRYSPTHFPHRVFFKITAGHGSKQCQVTLNGRTQEVDLGTDHVSPLTNMFYLLVHGAQNAYNQALATNYQPTKRILCTH